MRAAGLITVLLVVGGCARNAQDRQLDAVREEIDAVHAGRDRAHGGASSQNGGDGRDPGIVVPSAYATAAPAGPPPEVVQLGGDAATDPSDPSGESANGADPQDTTPRPTIRVFGSPRGGGGGRPVWRGADQIETTTPDEPSASSSSSSSSSPAPTTPPPTSPTSGGASLDPQAKGAYDAALALVNAKRYDEALDALARFLVKWPDHPYADHAMFWRGECYFARGDYKRAAEQFEGVLARFPSGAKVPDALLELGLSYEKLGNPMKAKQCFDRLAAQFPDSDASHRLAAMHTGEASR